MPIPPFPPNFGFGVANSDSQCEAFVEKFADIRDVWYERTNLQERGRATDFWNRFAEDIALAKGLGCNLFRFSVAWARVEPEAGVINTDALEHYSQVVDAVLAAGMKPVITLLHFVWPLHIQKAGGMIAADFPAKYVYYVNVVLKRLGDRVNYWITFNEPNALLFGYMKPWWEASYLEPPGLGPEAGFDEQIEAQIKLMRNLFLSHTAARKAIKAENPDAMVGVNSLLLGLPVWLQRLLDRNVLKIRTTDDAHRRGRAFAERPLSETGKIDVLLATFTRTTARASQLDFGDVYYVAQMCLVVRADGEMRKLKDLTGKRVAVVGTSTAETGVGKLIPGAVAAIVADHDEGWKRLAAGAVSAFLADDVCVLPQMQAQPGKYRLLADHLGSEPYAPGVAKGNPLLLDAVNHAVRGFFDAGKWEESFQRNLGVSPKSRPRYPRVADLADLDGSAGQASGTGPGAHPKDLLWRVKTRGKIRIGVKSDAPGMGYRDPKTGEWSGLEIDMARAIARQVFGDEGSLELVPVSTRQRIPFLRSAIRLLDPLVKCWGLMTSSANTNWWQLGMAGKLSPFLCSLECVGQLDYVGVDYYWGLSKLDITRVFGLLEALTAGRIEKAPVFPQGFYDLLKDLASLFPTHPILVIENGSVAVADNIDHASYLKLHLQQVQRAVADGVNVQAYLCWSITSNRELGDRFGPDTDFGLYHIDLDTDPLLVRHKTAAADAYQEVIAKRSAAD